MKEIRRRMKERALSSTDLGAKVGVSARTIDSYCNDAEPREPKHGLALAIMGELGAFSWEELMRERDTVLKK